MCGRRVILAEHGGWGVAVDDHGGEEPVHESEESQVFDQEYWDERYAAHQHVWSGRPNQRLVEVARTMPPGLALDVGCGEGADVVWLAERGWRATGVDLSVVALEKARRRAGEAGVADRATFAQVDLVAGDPLPGPADLVSAMYVHVPEADFVRVYTAIAGAVRPGGTLLVAAHHPAEGGAGLRSPRLGHLLFPPERVTAVLGPEWVLDVAEARTREIPPGDHGHPGGDEPVTATDTVVVARRSPA